MTFRSHLALALTRAFPSFVQLDPHPTEPICVVCGVVASAERHRRAWAPGGSRARTRSARG